jgi:hypothetical protein
MSLRPKKGKRPLVVGTMIDYNLDGTTAVRINENLVKSAEKTNTVLPVLFW